MARDLLLCSAAVAAAYVLYSRHIRRKNKLAPAASGVEDVRSLPPRTYSALSSFYAFASFASHNCEQRVSHIITTP